MKPKLYDNHDLNETWRRISRHEWATRYSKWNPRLRRLAAARERRQGMIAVLCDCDD